MKKEETNILHTLSIKNIKGDKWNIKLDDKKIVGIRSYELRQKSCEPIVELDLHLYCKISDLEISEEKNIK